MKKDVRVAVLDLFNCVVVDDKQKRGKPSLGLLDRGIITDFDPTPEQREVLVSVLKPLRMETLFTREERETASLHELLSIQVLHYIEVYGLGSPGLFEMTVDSGELVSLRYVHGITVEELQDAVQKLLYKNAPVEDADQLRQIIDEFELSFDLDRIANNEMRVALWRDSDKPFTRGDDAVRWLCYKATGNALLIKSDDVIEAIGNTVWPAFFFEDHDVQLAKVFNRHKRLILAAKNRRTATAINRISRLSKKLHVPILEPVAKTFVHDALTEFSSATMYDVLRTVTIRDKLKYLNALATWRSDRSTRLFRIRNGKIWYRENNSRYSARSISRVEACVLTSIGNDLDRLGDCSILLDPDVDYGLPVSRKQTLGRLPVGTVIWSRGKEISSGMYWENAWGAHDLDLSAVDAEGNRVGWGQLSGFIDREVTFSGDVTDAPNGAMEFMTSESASYGIVVNIYSGDNGSEMELVVGRGVKREQWMDEVVVRERHKLDSRNCLLGFVKGRTFVVYPGRMNNQRISGVNPTLEAVSTSFWTVRTLLDSLDFVYDIRRQKEKEYDYDLSYESFSFEKLEALFGTAA